MFNCCKILLIFVFIQTKYALMLYHKVCHCEGTDVKDVNLLPYISIFSCKCFLLILHRAISASCIKHS
jgi:hypothetical protein